jgi:hypothetical protein
VDPDPALYLNADPDPGNQTNADPFGSWSDRAVTKVEFLHEAGAWSRIRILIRIHIYNGQINADPDPQYLI